MTIDKYSGIWPELSIDLKRDVSESEEIKLSSLLKKENSIFDLDEKLMQYQTLNIIFQQLSVIEMKKLAGVDDVNSKEDILELSRNLNRVNIPTWLLPFVYKHNSSFLLENLTVRENYFIDCKPFLLTSLKSSRMSTLIVNADLFGNIGLYCDFGLLNSSADDSVWLFLRKFELVKKVVSNENLVLTT